LPELVICTTDEHWGRRSQWGAEAEEHSTAPTNHRQSSALRRPDGAAVTEHDESSQGVSEEAHSQ